MGKIYREDYPRPQFERGEWINLNGTWEFEYDDQNAGDKEQWYRDHEFSKQIQVPFCYQAKLSGIGETDFHDIVWYRRTFPLPRTSTVERIILHFGAVDYLAWVWVNGQLVKVHEGGHTPFHADITEALKDGDNTIVVKAQDFSKERALPRGKQYWKEKSEGIFYTRTTGIWQTVWMEKVNEAHLSKVKFTPDVDNNEIQIRHFFSGLSAKHRYELKAVVTYKGKLIAEEKFLVNDDTIVRRIGLNPNNEEAVGRRWSPSYPNLYDVEFTLLQDEAEVDHVKSYFGMRKVSVIDGKLCLNNEPIFMRLVLDQGYFPEGILTPPSDEDIRRDVELTKAMGFNGARKHQKVEDPRYLYWCDQMGIMVWGEMANAYEYNEEYVERFTKEWQEVIERDYNHPCIVAWVPINESWGVPKILTDRRQQNHALANYYLTHALDGTRPVISNDGWEHVKSDIFTIHDYEWRREVLEERYSTIEKAVNAKPANRWLSVPGYDYNGAPIHVSEFGGISYKKSDWEGWGYSGATTDEDFVERLIHVFHPLHQSPIVQGFCYTQLTDVEQEINGLLTYDRQPKLPLEAIREIVGGRTHEM
jgi:beta-galactosidase/beta-glucuronidase